MVVGFTTTYAISPYHHRFWWVRISIRVRCTTLCDKVCHWLVTGRWFSPGATVSSTNKTDRHDITEILLKVALNTIKQTKQTNKQTFKIKWVILAVLKAMQNRKIFPLIYNIFTWYFIIKNWLLAELRRTRFIIWWMLSERQLFCFRTIS